MGFIINRLLQRALYGNRHTQLADRVADAASRLRLIAPPAVEALMVVGDTLGKRYKAHDEQWLDE